MFTPCDELKNEVAPRVRYRWERPDPQALSRPGFAGDGQWSASSAASIETRISSNGVTLTCATLSGSKRNALCF